MTAWFSVVASAVKAGWRGWLVALAVGAFGAALVQCARSQDQACKARDAQASVATLRTDRAADDAAAVSRRADDQAIATSSQQVKDATHALPDQAPTARQHARACSLLQQRGAAADVLRTAGC